MPTNKVCCWVLVTVSNVGRGPLAIRAALSWTTLLCSALKLMVGPRATVGVGREEADVSLSERTMAFWSDPLGAGEA